MVLLNQYRPAELSVVMELGCFSTCAIKTREHLKGGECSQGTEFVILFN